MHDIATSPLADLGWDDALEAALAVATHPAVPARVSRSDRGGSLIVESSDGSERVRLSTRFRALDDATELPTVGDWVTLNDERLDGLRTVAALLPRRNAIVRQAPADRGATAQVLAANVDFAVIVVGLDREPNLPRLDRYVALAWDSGAQPLIVLTKADRCEDVERVVTTVEAAALGVPVTALSGLTGQGVERLGEQLDPRRTAVLLGMSGAGKSTLANRLLGDAVMPTQAVRGDGRGRHTTSHRELLRLPGGALLIDTPGLRELGLWDAEGGLAETFADIEDLAAACRFSDCLHTREPDCAVREAVSGGALTPERLASYEKLQREQAHLARKQDARLRQAEQRRWKTISKAMRAQYDERERGRR